MDDIMKRLEEFVGESHTALDSDVPYWLETGLPNVNLAISGRIDRGFPGGRIIGISGPESSGKTALATQALIAGQRLGGKSFMNDYEHAFHKEHARRQGLDLENFYYRRPNIAEEGFAIAMRILSTIRGAELKLKVDFSKEGYPKFIAALRKELDNADLTKFRPIIGLFDSIAAMTPAEQDIEYTNQNMKTRNMALAAMLSIELKRLARDAAKTGATIFLLNQLRTNPGVMFGDPSTEPGGRAMKYYASLLIRLRRVSKHYQTWGNKDTPIIGDVVEMEVAKNKVAPPFKKTKYVFRTIEPVGLDLPATMILLGKEAGILGAAGGTTIDSTEILGSQGSRRHKIAEFEALAHSDASVREALVAKVMSTGKAVQQGVVVADDDDDSDELSALGSLVSKEADLILKGLDL